MSPRPLVVDAQVHVWKGSTPDRPWPADAIEPQRVVPLEVPELRRELDAAGVQAALLLGPTWEGGRNDYVLEHAAADPARWGALCRFPTSDPAEVERLAHWRDVVGMRGIRLSLNRGDVAGDLERATRSGFFTAAERYGVPLSIYAPGRYDLYAELAQRHPALSITVDHVAVETVVPSLVDAVRPLRALARFPGVAVKASALPCFVAEEHPFPSLAPAVYELVDAFGAQRVFFGSDLSRLPVPYARLVDAFVEHLPRLDAPERELVLGRALTTWLDWPEPVAAREMEILR
ncbi:amidohydrolase family protein [Nocardioides zeae]|uniref:Amidohydrolase family protein n=1 Tax=Nocardioides imazamoxiresistens TaxID=3231893 RepID=A0ABU3PSF3_9ACTN|nr:amidohydrolase family protein [Nocardioides zeae]MDT9592158.1 amidohydrolase family protein [Nocardioides zeae]